jgi:hypothetical protein
VLTTTPLFDDVRSGDDSSVDLAEPGTVRLVVFFERDASVVDSEDAAPEGAPIPDEDESDPGVSAAARPDPVATAAPTPNATANAPTRHI